MTYQQKTINELLEKTDSNEGTFVDVQGYVSSVFIATLHDTPEITFSLHAAAINSGNIKGSRTYILVKFHPPENEIALAASALRTQEILSQGIRICGTYKLESKNKIIIMDLGTLGTGYHRKSDFQFECLTKYNFTSEERSSHIVEPK